MKKNYRYLEHLTLWNVIFGIICIPTAGKMIDAFGVPLSISIFYFPFIYILSDVLTEVYGYAIARRVLWYNIAAQVFTTIIFQFVVFYPPATGFESNAAFTTVLAAAPQLVFFGTIAVFIGDIANNYVLAKMKIRTKGKNPGLRFVTSTLVGQSVNTAFFYTFGLWGILPAQALFESVILASLAKVAVEIVMLPATLRISAWLKKQENEDFFDSKTDFNPLKI